MVPDCAESIKHVLPHLAEPLRFWRHAHIGDKTIAAFSWPSMERDCLYIWRGVYDVNDWSATKREVLPQGAGSITYEVYKTILEEDYREAIDL